MCQLFKYPPYLVNTFFNFVTLYNSCRRISEIFAKATPQESPDPDILRWDVLPPDAVTAGCFSTGSMPNPGKNPHLKPAKLGIIPHQRAFQGKNPHRKVVLGIFSHHRAGLGIISHHRAGLGMFSHHWVVLGIISHHRAVLGIFSHHQVVLGMFSHHWGVLGIFSHRQAVLGIISHHRAVFSGSHFPIWVLRRFRSSRPAKRFRRIRSRARQPTTRTADRSCETGICVPMRSSWSVRRDSTKKRPRP